MTSYVYFCSTYTCTPISCFPTHITLFDSINLMCPHKTRGTCVCALVRMYVYVCGEMFGMAEIVEVDLTPVHTGAWLIGGRC